MTGPEGFRQAVGAGRHGFTVIYLAALFLTSLSASTACAAPGPIADSLNEFNVELPTELRELAGHGKPSPVTHARVTIGVPANVDMANHPPVLIVSATADPEYHSSRRLLGRYSEAALANGWIIVAADPEENVSFEDDD